MPLATWVVAIRWPYAGPNETRAQEHAEAHADEHQPLGR